MQIVELSEKDKLEHNQFVAASPTGSFLQSWEWGEWQVRLGRRVFSFKITDDNGEQVGAVQLIKMPLPLGQYYLYAPYGPVIRKSENQKIGSQIFEQFHQRFQKAIFIRIEPKYPLPTTHSPLTTKTKNIQPGKSLVINLRLPEDQLLSQMHPKTRYNIRLAQKHGVEIKDEFAISVGHGIFFEEAIGLILQTSARQKFVTFSESYYRKMVDFFALNPQTGINLHIYKAIYQNQLLAAAIMIDFGKTRTFLFGGSSDTGRNVMAPYWLHFKAMLDAKAANLNFYDFWGVETSSGQTPGFVRFKMGFGPQNNPSITEYAGAYDVAFSRFWYKVYRGLRVVNKIKKLSWR